VQPLVDAAELSRVLTGSGRLFTAVNCVATTGSTNADLAAAAASGAPSGTVLVADHQSAGRGRFDRRWEALPGSSVALSVLLRPGDLALERWLWLPLITGVAVAEGLRAATGIEATVKWPNDVLIEGRKVCGILAERVDSAAVIGIGINTTLTTDELPVATATSLALQGSQASATEIVLGVLTALEESCRRWVEGGDLRAWFGRRCSTIGLRVRVHQSQDVSIDGLATGVDAWGRLVVSTPLGERAFAAGDVLHLR